MKKYRLIVPTADQDTQITVDTVELMQQTEHNCTEQDIQTDCSQQTVYHQSEKDTQTHHSGLDAATGTDMVDVSHQCLETVNPEKTDWSLLAKPDSQDAAVEMA